MAWQLFSPDLPFLNHITIAQTKNGFWDNALPYAPVVSAFFSALGIFFAYQIASKARAISAEQKEIAKRKLEFDLFDRRIKVIQIFFNVLNEISHKNFKKNENLQLKIDELFNVQILIVCLFNKEYYEYFIKIRKKVLEMAKLRQNEMENNSDLDNKNKIKNLIELFLNEYIPHLDEILNSYTPPFVVNERPNATPFPASHPTPPPTGLKAVRMRLKRAICGWSQPLQ